MSKPRLRFAPSPTGYLHIGGVRTALFNWLWAKKTGGTFILRIEDTDRERSTPENEQIIHREMRWLGLGWDEGPEVGGPHGPYRQMERLPLYAEFADKLVTAGAAYRCYCTKAELDAQREALKARDPKAQFVYPGTCRDRKPPLPDTPWVLRLRAPSAGAVTYHDLVFGDVTTPNSSLQDAVLMRSDGVPLYNLGAVVDDVTMGVTLVARGRDHMVNTPIQILLYRALGKEPPRFAHLPMMLAQDGKSKLSKRHGAVSVGEYRDKGYSPGAVLNYLVRFGWSYGDEEVFSLDDLVKKFDWERCGKADGRFDPKKFEAINFEHLKSAELTPASEYVDGVLPFLAKRGLTAERAPVAEIVEMVRPRAKTFEEAAQAMDYFFREPPEYDDKAVKKFLVSDKADLLAEVRELIASVADFSASGIEAALASWLGSKGIELKDVAQLVRVAVTGRSASPGLHEVLAVLGRQRSLDRLDRAVGIARGAG